MPSKIHIDPTLHQSGFKDRLRETYKGMAHIAGTGPGGGAAAPAPTGAKDRI